MTKYDAETVPLHDPGNSHAMVAELVGPDKRVLDAGCATGYLARALGAQGCTVVGLEYDAEAGEKARDALERLVIADLETFDLLAEFGPESFDAVVFGDVLEHLRNPGEVLRRVRPLLRPGGSVVVSVPNVAHGDLRLSLLAGRWTYTPVGLLDETHVRLFTHTSARQLLAWSGLAPVETRRIRIPLLQTEVGVRGEDFAPEVIAMVQSAPESDVYQFVIRAVLDDAAGALTEMSVRHWELEEKVTDLEHRNEDLQHLLDSATAYAAKLENEGGRRAEELARDLHNLRSTRLFRYTAAAREVYGRLRGSGL